MPDRDRWAGLSAAQTAYKNLNRWQEMLECGSAALLGHTTLRRAEEGTGTVPWTISCGYHRTAEAGECIEKRDLSGLMDLEAGMF